MKYERTILRLTLLFIIFSSCKTDNRFSVNTQNIPVTIQYTNIDSLFHSASNYEEKKQLHQQFINQFGELYRYEVSMNTQQVEDSLMLVTLAAFYADEYIKTLEKEKAALKPKVKEQIALLNNAFQHLTYHFPELAQPKHIFFINKLFSGIKSTDSLISVGLEAYIDKDAKIIQQIPNEQLYQWQKDAMNSDYLARDIMLNWIQNQLFVEIDETLAQHIIQAGKLLLILEATFPSKDGAFVLRYNQDQFKWAEQHEKLFWDYLVKEELLFKNNMRDKTNFLNEGPYTIGLPENGPDRLGQYLGWKIVKHYFKSHKNLSLQELVDTHYNSILQHYEFD